MAYEWKNNICCIGTYKTLEDNAKLDQFEENDISFEDAGKTKMSNLRYYLATTKNDRLLDHMSLHVAMQFLKDFSASYLLKKQKPTQQSAELVRKLAAVFKNKDKTIKDLAEVMDEFVAFEDE